MSKGKVMEKRESLSKKSSTLSQAGRIRVVVGAVAIGLAWMEFVTPSNASAKWRWLQNLLNQTWGELGFVGLIAGIGVAFIAWGLSDLLRKNEG